MTQKFLSEGCNVGSEEDEGGGSRTLDRRSMGSLKMLLFLAVLVFESGRIQEPDPAIKFEKSVFSTFSGCFWELMVEVII